MRHYASFFAVFVASFCFVFPHQDGIGYWQVEIGPDSLRSIISISLLDLNFVPELDSDGDELVEYEEVIRHRSGIESRLLEHFQVLISETGEPPQVREFQVLESGDIILEFEYPVPETLQQLELRSTFTQLTDSDHRIFCKLEWNGKVRQYLFDIYNSRYIIELDEGSSGTFQQMGRFVVLGVEHIFTGYDHLAFLLALILLGGSLQSLIGVVSSFTIAHSVTLSLATLDVLVFPTEFVESAIALSICYIALENIFVEKTSGRWKITFFFGLIHGFGFSTVLREMNLPSTGLLTSLFSFNLGVEIGQVVIIAMVCPLVFFLARQTWHKVAVTVTSALIGGLGLVWFVDRLM